MKLQIIKDSIGNNYIGIDVTNDVEILNMLTIIDTSDSVKTLIKENNINFNDCLTNVMKRNNDSFHITVFNVAECRKNPKLLEFDQFPLIEDIINKGIGFISKGDKFTFFSVVESIGINKMRESLELPHKDLHITLGFTHKDLFHGRKNVPNLFQLGI